MVAKNLNEVCVKKVRANVDVEAMKAGYQQMWEINLSMANEGFMTENEADQVINDFLSV